MSGTPVMRGEFGPEKSFQQLHIAKYIRIVDHLNSFST